jgi:ABC-type bacteriocin/lantibiotic exporter with double-glycine peptidase domain
MATYCTVSRQLLPLFACLLASGCYMGSARNAKLAEILNDGDWELVEGVPEVRQVAREDCGAAALAMVLGYWGRPANRDDIRAAYSPAPDRGIKAASLRQFTMLQGLQAFLIHGQFSDLDREIQRRHPILVGVMKRYRWHVYPHYEVVVGVNRKKQHILTLDPAHGLRVNSREGFAAEWAATHEVTLIVFPHASASLLPTSRPVIQGTTSALVPKSHR